MALRKATRLQTKMRISISGISGSGKTFSSLLLAKGLVGSWDKIAVINTEKGRSDVYAGLGEFNVLELTPPFSPEKLTAAIKEVEQETSIECIIIDSASSEWQDAGGCLEINEIIANTKYRGNTWSAWNETVPRHHKFIGAIEDSRCHIIATLMAKEATTMAEGKVKKLADKEIQREGFRRDMIVAFMIDHETHRCIVLKDNCLIDNKITLFAQVDPFIISEETGKTLRTWAEGGAPQPIQPKSPVIQTVKQADMAAEELFTTPVDDTKPAVMINDFQRKKIFALSTDLGNSADDTKALIKKHYHVDHFNDLTREQAAQIITSLMKRVKAQDKQNDMMSAKESAQLVENAYKDLPL